MSEKSAQPNGHPSTRRRGLMLLPRGRRSAVVLAAVLAFSLGCDAAERMPSAPLQPRLNTSGGAYSADELFMGIMLGQGPVAGAIDVIRDDYKVENIAVGEMSVAYLTDFGNRLLAQVKVVEPSFLAGFKQAMESDDPYVISDKLDHASRVINEAVKALPEGAELAYHAENPLQTEATIAQDADASGYVSLSDTAVTPVEATDGIEERHYYSYTSKCLQTDPNCEPAEPLSSRPGRSTNRAGHFPGSDEPSTQGAWVAAVAGVYVAVAVHVAVVYNVALAMVWGVQIAIKRGPYGLPGGGRRIKERLIDAIMRAV